MKANVRIGRLLGIDIELHYSWFFIVLLLAFGLAAGFFPEYYPGLTTAEYWIIGSVSAVLLFASVLAHELMHSIVAKRYKIGVEKITLFFFGGVAQIAGEDITPKKEFMMAVAGPIFSLFLALFFWIVWKSTAIVHVQAVCFYLTLLNLILGLFNLAPGFPLDGGRIFRAILWGYYKDVKKATRIAAYGGKVVAVLLIMFGFAGFFGIGIRIFGVVFGGIWFILLGFFLYFLAGMSYEQIIIKEVLSKVKVKEIMKKRFISVRETLPIADLFSKYFLGHAQESFLVVKGQRLLGIVNVDCLRRVPKHKWLSVLVKDVMIPANRIKTAKLGDGAYGVLVKMSKQGLNIMPVIKDKKLVGIVDVGSLIRFTRLKIELE